MAIKILLTLFLVVAGLLIYVKHIQATAIFFPSRELQVFPVDLNLSFQDVYIKTPDGEKLNGWFFPQDSAKTTLLFLHGNGGNISHRLDKIKLLLELGLNVFIVDYRGYGRSTGTPSEKGLYIDAFSAWDYLTRERGLAPEKIIVYGESLGAAAAIDLAAKVAAGGLIVEGGFSSGRDMGRVMYPFMPQIFIPDMFNSMIKIKNVTSDKLFIHSPQDEIVPFRLGELLYKAAQEPKDLAIIAGGHNSLHDDSHDDYLKALGGFLQGLRR
jgi:uncharacterized protein